MTLLTYTQAAARMSMKVSTLRSMVCRKQVPHVRLGGKLVRFDVAELEKWLAEHSVAVNEESK